jgi:SAM-dependent methyltransferase
MFRVRGAAALERTSGRASVDAHGPHSGESRRQYDRRVTLDEYRAASRAAWEMVASGWVERAEQMLEWGAEVTERMLAALDARPGETILELAAGAGDTGFLAARQVGPTGRVISTDFAPAMVAAARRRAAELGLDNVEFRVVDAESLVLDTDSVDGILCRWGYMLMGDPATALRESRRVLRPKGKLVFSVWAEPARNPWASVVGRLLVEGGHMPPPEPEAPGIFALAEPERIAQLVAGAGFERHQVEEVEAPIRFRDFGDYWDFVLHAAGGLSITISRLSDGEREALRAAVQRSVARFAEPNGGVSFPGLARNVVAR